MVDDIIREIDDDLRSDKLKRLWARYSVVVYAAVAAIVLGVAGYSYWDHHQAQLRAAEGARYGQAMLQADQGDAAAAMQTLASLAREAGGGYGTLARLYEADLLLGKGDLDGALQRFDAVATDSGVDRPFRDLAVLLGASHRVDRDDPAALIQRLQPLLAEDNPWRFSARELTGIAALRAGNAADARSHFTRLADDAAAPPGIRARAAELLKTIGG